jgi:beta-glucosidase-like glycosyl hydrolase
MISLFFEMLMLLFHKAKVLPLSDKIQGKVAVIGPLANVSEELLGNYNGQPETIVTIFEGIKYTPFQHRFFLTN